MKKALLWLLFLVLPSMVCAHDNKVVHPYLIVGKAMDLIKKKKGPKHPMYLELSKYFNLCPEEWVEVEKYIWDEEKQKKVKVKALSWPKQRRTEEARAMAWHLSLAFWHHIEV
jgi:hypothetical protein